MTIRKIGGVFGRHPEFQTATVKGDLLLGTALQFVCNWLRVIPWLAEGNEPLPADAAPEE